MYSRFQPILSLAIVLWANIVLGSEIQIDFADFNSRLSSENSAIRAGVFVDMDALLENHPAEFEDPDINRRFQELIQRGLHDEDYFVRQLAILQSLPNLDSLSTKTRELLADSVLDPNWGVRATALNAIKKLGPRLSNSVDEIGQLLRNNNSVIEAYRAIDALEAIGVPALSLLRKLKESHNYLQDSRFDKIDRGAIEYRAKSAYKNIMESIETENKQSNDAIDE